jgi:hypothetical protein
VIPSWSAVWLEFLAGRRSRGDILSCGGQQSAPLARLAGHHGDVGDHFYKAINRRAVPDPDGVAAKSLNRLRAAERH